MMPFEWSISNINQTTIIHEEIIIPKTFGDLLVPEYNVTINGFEIPQRVIMVDDFSETRRIIHLMINQNDLLELYEKHDTMSDHILFAIHPKESDFTLGTVTSNGKFKILLDWTPKEITSNSTTNFVFVVKDLSQNNIITSVDYNITVIHDKKTLFSANGKSSTTEKAHNEFSMFIPENVSGSMSINFLNIDGNKLGKATIPIAVNKIQDKNTQNLNGYKITQVYGRKDMQMI